MYHHRAILPILALAIFGYPSISSAAALSVIPDTPTVTVGSTFGATIYIDSAGVSINASDGTLSFPPDMLEAQSVAYGTSIFTLWAQEPSINNGSGVVSWSGGSTTGFVGTHGRALRVTFLAKKVGIASLTLPSSSIYANDGLGTNVAVTPDTSSVAIVSSPTPVSSVPPTQVGDERIIVSSPTHPSQDTWYASTTAQLVWQVPTGADAVKTILSERESASPFLLYRPAISERSVDALPDGISYFNIRGHYADGWGPVTSYRLKIDTTPPVFSAASMFYDATSSVLSVFATATDTASGVKDYALMVDGTSSAVFTAEDVTNGSYRVPTAIDAGTHIVQVRAFDYAGNAADSKAFTFVAPPQAESHVGWFFSFTLGNWILLIAILLSIFSIIMNIVLWMRLRLHENRLVRGIDTRKIRSLTVDQLTRFRKEVASEARVLERAYGRRDITIEEADEIKKMHHHLLELEAFIEKQISTIDKS